MKRGAAAVLQLRTGSTFTASMKNGRITAIPLSSLAPAAGPPVGYGESDAMPMSGLDTFSTDATATADPTTPSTYVVMGGAFLRNEAAGAATGADAIGRIAVDGADIGEMSFRAVNGHDFVPFFDLQSVDWAAGSRTMTVDYRAGTAGASKRTFIKDSRVVAIPLASCP